MSNTATAIRQAEALEAQAEAVDNCARAVTDVRVDLIAALDRLTSAVEAQTRTLSYIESVLAKHNRLGGL